MEKCFKLKLQIDIFFKQKYKNNRVLYYFKRLLAFKKYKFVLHLKIPKNKLYFSIKKATLFQFLFETLYIIQYEFFHEMFKKNINIINSPTNFIVVLVEYKLDIIKQDLTV